MRIRQRDEIQRQEVHVVSTRSAVQTSGSTSLTRVLSAISEPYARWRIKLYYPPVLQNCLHRLTRMVWYMYLIHRHIPLRKHPNYETDFNGYTRKQLRCASAWPSCMQLDTDAYGRPRSMLNTQKHVRSPRGYKILVCLRAFNMVSIKFIECMKAEYVQHVQRWKNPCTWPNYSFVWSDFCSAWLIQSHATDLHKEAWNMQFFAQAWLAAAFYLQYTSALLYRKRRKI